MARQPTIPEIAAYYRERKMACVIFSVDGLRARGIKPVSNEEVAELAAENADVHDSVREHRSRRAAPEGVREARRLIEHYGVAASSSIRSSKSSFRTIAPRIRCTK